MRLNGGDTIVTLTTPQKILIGVAVASAIAVGVYVAIQVFQIKTSGRIIAIGTEVYKDVNCTEQLKEIDWGDILEGETKVVSCYVKNVKTARVTLELFTNNYQPTELEYVITCVWNVSLTKVLEPQEVIPAIITLTIADDALGITSFSYDIVIKATYTP